MVRWYRNKDRKLCNIGIVSVHYTDMKTDLIELHTLWKVQSQTIETAPAIWDAMALIATSL